MMETIRRSRNAIAIAILFVVIGLAFLVLAGPVGYKVDFTGVTLLIGLGAAMGLMAYALLAGTPRD